MKAIRRTPPLRWLILPIEIKHRELDAKLWLGCCAAERGYGVILGDIDQVYECHRALPRGAFVDKSIAPRKTKILRRLSQAGQHLCVNDEEALLAYNRPAQYLASRLNRETLSMTRRFFAWGDDQATLVREAHPALADRVHSVGTPRTDLWTTDLRRLHEARVKEIRAKYGRYILLPSNFCDILHVNGPDFRLEQARRAGQIRGPEDEALHSQRRAHRERVLQGFVAALEAIRDHFMDISVVVRPHPSDDVAAWQRLVGHIDGCWVVHEGAATPWLLGAEAIVHNGCTTAIEAFLLGKMPVSYHPYWDDRFEYSFQTRVGPAISELPDLLAQLEEVIAGKAAAPSLENSWLARHMRVAPDRSVAERMLDIIDEMKMARQRLVFSWLGSGYARYRTELAGKRMEKRLRHWRRATHSRTSDALKQQKWPPTPADEVAERCQAIRQVTGRFSEIAVRHLDGDLYVLGPASAGLT